MRLYWPSTEPPSILPPGEGTWQPPPLQRVTTAAAKHGKHGKHKK